MGEHTHIGVDNVPQPIGRKWWMAVWEIESSSLGTTATIRIPWALRYFNA